MLSFLVNCTFFTPFRIKIQIETTRQNKIKFYSFSELFSVVLPWITVCFPFRTSVPQTSVRIPALRRSQAKA
jgi:hypothetical protein